jgi:Integral peroxisomal membrane peroxin
MSASASNPDNPTQDPNPPTIAAFSPNTPSRNTSATKNRSTILVHQKSPLLVATPPQITRALAFSHPFLLPLNKFVGLLTWTSGDPWESFLLVAGFWAVVLYGGVILRWAGPVVVVLGLIVAMYSRRYSPLSSTATTGEKQTHKRGRGGSSSADESQSARHHKSLDEILETLKEFTARCNVLLDPCLRLTDFLSTQRSATSATTRPALTTLLIRILLVTPVWFALTVHPISIITTKRIVLAGGTVFLTWHSRPALVSRTILWRSKTVRKVWSFVTGLQFSDPSLAAPHPTHDKAATGDKNAIYAASVLAAKHRPGTTGVKITFILYENQRRWLGIGWTHSLLAYERAAWTDEHLYPAPQKEEYELPAIEGGNAKWRWVKGSEWRVEGAKEGEEGAGSTQKAGKGGKDSEAGGGWIYYDNKVNIHFDSSSFSYAETKTP